MRGLVWLKAAAAAALLLVSTSAWAASAPDFTLRDVEGNQVSLSEHKGKVVVLTFWATWCGPCKVEMPHMEQLRKDYEEQGLVVLSISQDSARTASQVKPFVKSKGYGFVVLLDTDSKVSTMYNPQKAPPYTVIVDRDGNIVYQHAGYNPGDEIKLRDEVKKALGVE